MRKHLEHFLLSVLMGTTILLGLTFWLNVRFGFNIFSNTHWQELASLQASGANIDKDFYLSVGVAVFVFILVLNIIYRPRFRKIPQPSKKQNKTVPVVQSNPIVPEKHPEPVVQTDAWQNKIEPIIETKPTPESKEISPTTNPTSNTGAGLVRPPKLHLPKNMAQIVANQYANQTPKINQSDKYNDDLAKIFSERFYTTKKCESISGFTPNLIAIAHNEIVWIGGVDCDMDKLKFAISRMDSTFKETLEDIQIHINGFLIDTNHMYKSDGNIHVFNSIPELQEYLDKNPVQPVPDEDREDFAAYSEYIDSVLTLLYKT